MMKIEEVMEIIENDYMWISSCETFKEVIEEKYNSSYVEALEAIKDFVKYDTDYWHLDRFIGKYTDEYTDEEYIIEFLKDVGTGYLCENEFNEFYIYSNVLNQMAI